MNQLKFLVRYEGLDGREDCEKTYTFDEILQGCHEEDCFYYRGEVEKRIYKIEEIQPFNFDGWIMVEDDLPGTYEHCLCYDGEEMFIGYLSNRLKWYAILSGHFMASIEPALVTHWQYLPKPPETGKR